MESYGRGLLGATQTRPLLVRRPDESSESGESDEAALTTVQTTHTARVSMPAGVTLGSRGLDLIVLGTVFGDGFNRAGLNSGTVIDSIDGIRHGKLSFGTYRCDGWIRWLSINTNLR